MSGSGSGSTNTEADYVYSPKRGLEEAFRNVNGKSEEAMLAATPIEIQPAATFTRLSMRTGRRTSLRLPKPKRK